jgi:alpha-1,3-rhamnosyl/mannosyltransferase
VGLASVATLHDAIAERFPHLTLPTRRARLFWRAKIRLAIWQSRLILTVSDFSARELTAVLGIPAKRIRVAVEAPAEAYRPSAGPAEIAAAAARAGLPAGASWFIYVGGFNPHKRLDVLVGAHAAIAAERGAAAPYLILVGSAQDGFYKNVDAIKREIEAAGTGHLVRWVGFVPDDELRHLHSGAVALAIVSECEGFGLPAIEAAACGTPVIATTQSPLPELLRGGGLFVDPGDGDALTAAMRQLLDDSSSRRLMGARAQARAHELTWESSARAVLAALREAAAGNQTVLPVQSRRDSQPARVAV